VKGATAADSVFIYEFPKPENIFLMNDIFEYPLGSFRKKYMSHCIGIIVLRGDGIAEVHFKMFLSDKGYMHKDKYIDKLLASIRFEE